MKEIIPYVYLNNESEREVLEFRLVIEVETARIAASKITDEEILLLEKSLKKMLKNKGDIEKYVEEDLNFHMIIAKSTKNSLVIEVNNIVRNIIRRMIRTATEKIGHEVGLKYHRLLIEAFRKRDADTASDMMREHLQQVLERLV